ncbi:MAG: response regulator transcription factor [Myxococcaceae bacterium]
MHLLLVEDDPKLAAMLERGLREEDHRTTVAASGEKGLELLQAGAFDLCILDVMLPGLDGFQTLSKLRERGHELPVLMLTARDAVQDRVKGLRAGADDYLAKPFAFSELLARLDALQRRNKRQGQVLRVGRLQIDLARHVCEAGGEAVDLSARQFALLALLAKSDGGVVSRATVLNDVLGYTVTPSANIVDVHVSNLRQKLAKVDAGVTIVTVRGVGYRLDEAAE